MPAIIDRNAPAPRDQYHAMSRFTIALSRRESRQIYRSAWKIMISSICSSERKLDPCVGRPGLLFCTRNDALFSWKEAVLFVRSIASAYGGSNLRTAARRRAEDPAGLSP